MNKHSVSGLQFVLWFVLLPSVAGMIFLAAVRDVAVTAVPPNTPELTQADLSGQNFAEQFLNGADFSAKILINVSFQGAHLRGANFRDADLRNAVLIGADL